MRHKPTRHGFPLGIRVSHLTLGLMSWITRRILFGLGTIALKPVHCSKHKTIIKGMI